jgi:hypothetical protein
MTVRRRLVEELVFEALERGEVAVAGQQLVLTASGQAVMPRLEFETVQSMSSLAGPRLGASVRHDEEHETMGMKYAELPEEVLTPTDPAVAQAQQRAQQAALRTAADRRRALERMKWPEGFAPLPPERLVRNRQR